PNAPEAAGARGGRVTCLGGGAGAGVASVFGGKGPAPVRDANLWRPAAKQPFFSDDPTTEGHFAQQQLQHSLRSSSRATNSARLMGGGGPPPATRSTLTPS